MVVKRSMYVCDFKFHVSDAIELCKDHEEYGVILVSGKNTRLYTFNKFDYKLVTRKETRLQKSQKKGGQSAQRFGRIKQEKDLLHLYDLVDKCVSAFYDFETNTVTVKGILVAGPGEWKHKVSKHKDFQKYLGSHVVNVVSTKEIDSKTIESIDITMFNSYDTKVEKTHQEEIKNIIETNPDSLVFGEKEVISHLENYMLKKVFISHRLEKIKDIINYDCEIIILQTIDLEEYGGTIGIKWY